MTTPLAPDTLPEHVLSAIAQEAERVRTSRGSEDQRRVLIVGGAGYIGAPVTSGLLDAGYRVRVLDQLTYEHGSAISAFHMHPGYDFIRGDMGNRATMDEALKDVSVWGTVSGGVAHQAAARRG